VVLTTSAGNAAEVLLEDGRFAALADAAHRLAIASLTAQRAQSPGFRVEAGVSDNCWETGCLAPLFQPHSAKTLYLNRNQIAMVSPNLSGTALFPTTSAPTITPAVTPSNAPAVHSSLDFVRRI
jgi:hypothetical protein